VPNIEEAAKSALKAILRRVKEPEAGEVKSQLPREWLPDFQDCGALDTSVTSATVLSAIGKSLGVSTERAQALLPKITRAFADFIPPESLFRAFSQLPYEMRQKIDINDERLHAKDIDMYAITPPRPPIGSNSIEDFLNKKVVILKRTDTLHSASLAMAENNVGSILISNSKGEMVGVLTDRDLACTISVVKNGLKAPISEAMSEGEIVSVDDTSQLRTVIKKMIDHGVRRIPVMATSGRRPRCRGIITLDDLLAAKVISIDEVSQIAAKQIHPSPHRASRAILRSVARRAQTARKFRKALANKIGLLDELEAESATKWVLRILVKRVKPETAADLITQLPALWQDELYGLASGPEKLIGAGDIIDNLSELLKIDGNAAQALFVRIVNSLADLISRGEMVDFVAQLPIDMKEMLNITAR